MLTANRNVWVPVSAGMAAGFILSLYLNMRDALGVKQGRRVFRQIQKTLLCFGADGIVAFVLFIAWNHSGNWSRITQAATSAAVLAMLIPFLFIRAKALYLKIRGHT